MSYQENEALQDAQIITTPDVDTRQICVVYVGDVVPSRHKRAAVYRMGGKHFPSPNYYTVPNGIVEQCSITRLREGMRAVYKGVLDDDNAGIRVYKDSYRLKNFWDKRLGQFVDKEIGIHRDGKGVLQKPFRFFPIKPGQEIGAIAERGEDGVIALRGILNSKEDILAAQLHFFPQWLDIRRNPALLPNTLRKLEDHLSNRLAVTTAPEFIHVGQAFIQSCAEYRMWGQRYIDYQLQAMEEHKGGGIRHDEIAERLFLFLEIARKDSLITNVATQSNDNREVLNKMGDAMGMMAELMRQNQELRANQELAAANASFVPMPVTREDALEEMKRQVSDVVEEDVVVSDFTDMSDLIPPAATDEEIAVEIIQDGEQGFVVVDTDPKPGTKIEGVGSSAPGSEPGADITAKPAEPPVDPLAKQIEDDLNEQLKGQ
jgi:hypothetical protein